VLLVLVTLRKTHFLLLITHFFQLPIPRLHGLYRLAALHSLVF
jgi:hypothetical protein